MANRKRGEVDIRIDGTTHTLKFDYNALCTVEERCGDQPLDYLLTTGGRGMSRKFVREALYCGLISIPSSRKTPKKIGEMIQRETENDPNAYALIIKDLLTAIMYANGSADDEIESMRSSLDGEIEEGNAVPREDLAGDVPLEVPVLDMIGTS